MNNNIGNPYGTPKSNMEEWVAFDNNANNNNNDFNFDLQWDQNPQPPPPPHQSLSQEETMFTPVMQDPSDDDDVFDPYGNNDEVPLEKTVSIEKTSSALTAKTNPETPPRRQIKKPQEEYEEPHMIAKNLTMDTDSNSSSVHEDPEQPRFGDEDNPKPKSNASQKPRRRRYCILYLTLAIVLLAIAGALGFIVYIHLFHKSELPETEAPILGPSASPSFQSSDLNTSGPTVNSASPTMFSIPAPTTRPPTSPPSRSPSHVPSASPTAFPSVSPTLNPTSAREKLLALLSRITDGRTVQAIDTPGTPQQLAYEWMLNDPAYSDYKERRIVQRFAMATVYYSNVKSETSMEAMTTWLDHDTNECTWFTSWYENRISCGSDNIFKTLALRNVALMGTIPSEIALLSHLNTLVLSDNILTGTLPKEFGQWASLIKLDVHSNFLTGRIPLWTNAPNLRDVRLSNNRLTGVVPSSIANLNLTSLDLSENDLRGVIPQSVCSNPYQRSQIDLMTVDCDQVTCYCCTQCGANRTRAPVLTPFTPPPSPPPTRQPTTPPTTCVSSIQFSKVCYLVGEPILMTFQNCDPFGGDWLGLYDYEDSEKFLLDPLLWHWSCGSQDCSGSPIEGSAVLDASAVGQSLWPLNRGNYKVYLVRNGAGYPYQPVVSSKNIRVAQRICPD